MARSSQLLWYAIALVLGLASGYVHMLAPDPTVVALLALASAMFVSFMRPERPWLWSVILALSLPVADAVMYLRGMPFYRGRIEGAFIAGLASGLVGGYAGSFGRRTLQRLFAESRQSQTPAQSDKTVAVSSRAK